MVSLLHLAAKFLLTASIRRPAVIQSVEVARLIVMVIRDSVQLVRYRPRMVSRYTQSRTSVNRVYDSEAWRYAEDSRTESEVEVTNNKKLHWKYCMSALEALLSALEALFSRIRYINWHLRLHLHTVEAIYRQIRSIVRPLCASRVSCYASAVPATWWWNCCVVHCIMLQESWCNDINYA